MSDKIKEIDFKELWQKICELKDMAIKADNAGLLLDGLYDNDVNFIITDTIDRDYADDGSYEVISRDDQEKHMIVMKGDNVTIVDHLNKEGE